MVPVNRRVSQSNLDMVKAKLLEAQNRVGQLEPDKKLVTLILGSTSTSHSKVLVPSGPTQPQ